MHGLDEQRDAAADDLRAPHVGSRRGSVQTVPFRQYVTTVLTPEWSVGPVDVMRIGAIAVKEYAWYWTMVWRGKKAADGSCYDVIDSTQDQLYRPERDPVDQTLAAAVDATWTVSFRKNGRLFATGYRAGSSVACGADRTAPSCTSRRCTAAAGPE